MTISLSTVPLVIGLFALSPVSLITARLIGSAVTLVVHRRQRPMKLSLNLASFWAQTATSVVMFRALSPHTVGPSGWGAALLAVVVGDLVQVVVLAGAISLYQRRW